MARFSRGRLLIDRFTQNPKMPSRTGSPRVAFGYNLSYTELMKTAVSIPDPIFREAERLTRRLHIPRSRLYASALQAYLRQHSTKGITEALNAVYSKEVSEMDPVVNRLQDLAIGREDW